MSHLQTNMPTLPCSAMHKSEYLLTVIAMWYSMTNGLDCQAHIVIEKNTVSSFPFALLTFLIVLQKTNKQISHKQKQIETDNF